jgi:hypothetical protein
MGDQSDRKSSLSHWAGKSSLLTPITARFVHQWGSELFSAQYVGLTISYDILYVTQTIFGDDSGGETNGLTEAAVSKIKINNKLLPLSETKALVHMTDHFDPFTERHSLSVASEEWGLDDDKVQKSSLSHGAGGSSLTYWARKSTRLDGYFWHGWEKEEVSKVIHDAQVTILNPTVNQTW